MHTVLKRMGSKATEYLDSQIGNSFPGYAFLVGKKRAVSDCSFGGMAVVEPEAIPVREDTLYDLASLTKPLCTALLALQAHEAGELDLHAPVPGAAGPPFTLLDLLRHEAGFPAWLPLYSQGIEPGETLPWLLTRCPRGVPRERAEYSCPGYILAGLLLESTLGASLDRLFRVRVLERLGLEGSEVLFNPSAAERIRTAATELAGAHEARMAREAGGAPMPVPAGGLWGAVCDGNARFLGGASGNAGLFGTVRGVFGLAEVYLDGSKLLGHGALNLSRSPSVSEAGERRTAGWKCAESPGWASGRALPAGCLGHEGFPGTGVWLDTRRGRAYVLLTNRIHPRHPESDFGPVRAAFLRRAQEALP